MADDQGPVAPNIPDPGTLSGILASQGTPDPQQPQDATQNTIPQINQSVDVNAPQGTEPQLDPRGPEGTIPQAEQEPLPTFQQHYKTAGNILDRVATMIAGDEAWKVRKDTAGNVTVERDPATRGEKWGRIAAAAIGGAIKGMGAGQGPGGGAKALAAGGNFGMQIPAQQKENADQAASAEQERMKANANVALLHQKAYLGMLQNRQLEGVVNQQDANILNTYRDKMAANGKDYGPIKDESDLMRVSNDPQFLKDHMGQAGQQLNAIPVRGKDGKMEIHAISSDLADDDKPVTKDDHLFQINVDPKTSAISLDQTTVAPQGMKQGPLRIANQAKLAEYIEAHNKQITTQANADKKDQDHIPKTAAEARIAAGQETDPAKKQALLTAAQQIENNPATKAETAARYSEASLNNAKLKVLQGTAGAAPGAKGLTGDAYLQASGIDPSAWNQIKATANGDIKIPTASRSPQNQAFRNAVMNYDPTFKDSRYDAKQNFRTKGDATSVTQLSTALEHLERATGHSAQLGFSPSLASGHTMSGPAADYNQDIKLFTQEAGKLVANKAITQGEYEDLKKDMTSPVQSIRDHALSETVNLMGGKVQGLMQKYKTAVGQDLNPQEFFDQNTQKRLQKYGVIGQQPGPGPTPTPTPGAFDFSKFPKAP